MQNGDSGSGLFLSAGQRPPPLPRGFPGGGRDRTRVGGGLFTDMTAGAKALGQLVFGVLHECRRRRKQDAGV